MGIYRQVLAACVACCVWALAAHAARESPAPGSLAPDFTARDIVSNNRVRLSEAQGKLVFVTFWATWCAACRSELPILENVQKKLGKDKAAVYAVSFQETASPRGLRDFVKEHNWQLTLLEDPNGRIAQQYGITAIPHLFIIGRDRRILAVHTGYGEDSIPQLVDEINAALRTFSAASDDNISAPAPQEQ
jgi:peroxiredoxin